MRKLLFTLACLCVLASATRAQDPTYPTSYSRGGNITTSSANCDPTACIGIGLPTPSASVITVGLTGTWSGTLSPEESQDGGRTFTSAGAGLTSNGTTSYVIAGFTSFRIRAGTLASGNAGVNLTVSNAPTGSVTSGTTDPTGNACSADALYVQTTTGNLYTCKNGAFALSGGSGTVTAVTGTSPIASSGGTTPAISCPTCTTSAAALTSNAVVLGAGSQGAQTVAGIASDGVSVLTLGVNGTVAGGLGLKGATSGTCSLTPNSTGTTLNTCAVSSSGTVSGGAGAFSGTVSSGGFSGVSTGAPVQVSSVTSSGQSASIGATTMLANPAADRNFRFNVSIGQQAQGTTCSVAGSVSVSLIFTDAITGNVLTYVVPLEISGGTALGASIPLSTSAPTVANYGSGVIFIRAKASTNVQFSTTYSAGTCSVGSPTYSIARVLEAL